MLDTANVLLPLNTNSSALSEKNMLKSGIRVIKIRTFAILLRVKIALSVSNLG
jgi:hypothetical protein